MMKLKKLNIEEIRELYNDYYFKKTMEANINHILFNMNYEYKFELDANSETSYSKDNLIHIGLPNECIGMTQEKIYAIVKGLVGHETAHIRWSNFKEREKAIDKYYEEGGNHLLYSAISNILEDGRVERLLCEELRGFRKYIKFLNKELLIKNNKLKEDSILINLTKSILYLAVIGKYPSNYQQIFSEQQKQTIEKEIAPRILESVKSNSFKTVLDNTTQIIEIMNSMIDKAPDEKENRFLMQLSAQTYNSSNGKDDNDDSTNKDTNSNESNNSSALENSKSNSETNDDFNNSESSTKDTNISNHKSSNNTTNQNDNNLNSTNDYKSNNSTTHGLNNSSQQQNVPANHIGSEDYDKSFTDSDIFDENIYVELERLINNESKKALDNIKLKASIKTKEEELNQSSELKGKIDYHSEIDLDSINAHYNSRNKEPFFKYEYPDIPYEEVPKEFNMDIRILENEFKKFLNYKPTTIRHQKKGRLDSNKLWKLSMHDGNVFYKNNNNSNGDCAVYILIDLSGSTAGDIYRLEMATACCIEQALMNIPNIEVKTVGFNYVGTNIKSGYSRMKVFKDFKETKSKTPYAYRHSFAGGSNRDGFAIRVALDDLKKHSAKNKLLLILSDGMPAWNGETKEEAMADVKNAIHEGRKSTTIMSVLLTDEEIDNKTKECFNYMYEDRGNISIDTTKESEKIIKYLSLYIKRVLKRR